MVDSKQMSRETKKIIKKANTFFYQHYLSARAYVQKRPAIARYVSFTVLATIFYFTFLVDEQAVKEGRADVDYQPAQIDMPIQELVKQIDDNLYVDENEKKQRRVLDLIDFHDNLKRYEKIKDNGLCVCVFVRVYC